MKGVRYRAEQSETLLATGEQFVKKQARFVCAVLGSSANNDKKSMEQRDYQRAQFLRIDVDTSVFSTLCFNRAGIIYKVKETLKQYNQRCGQ